MPLLNAKCTNCGAILRVDSSMDAAVCDHCGAAFIVEKAITNYSTTTINGSTVNINQGPSAENLLMRGLEYEQKHSYEKALSYYNKVLDIEWDNRQARDGVERIKDILDNTVIYTENISKYNRDKGILTLTRKYLDFEGKKTSVSFEISKMENVCAKENINYMGVGGLGRPLPNCLFFFYENRKQWIFCRSGKAVQLAEIINELILKQSTKTINVFADDD